MLPLTEAEDEEEARKRKRKQQDKSNRAGVKNRKLDTSGAAPAGESDDEDSKKTRRKKVISYVEWGGDKFLDDDLLEYKSKPKEEYQPTGEHLFLQFLRFKFLQTLLRP